jgi:hypothetical protein
MSQPTHGLGNKAFPRVGQANVLCYSATGWHGPRSLIRVNASRIASSSRGYGILCFRRFALHFLSALVQSCLKWQHHEQSPRQKRFSFPVSLRFSRHPKFYGLWHQIMDDAQSVLISLRLQLHGQAASSRHAILHRQPFLSMR